MLEAASKKLVCYALKNNYISQEQYEENLYAVQIVMSTLFTDATMLIIALAFGMIWQCALFWLTYMLLRKYCGGYHFDSSFKCYLSSVIMCPFVLLAVKYLPYDFCIWTIFSAFAVTALLILSPVEAMNKPLDEKERAVFGKIARCITLFVETVYIIISAFDCPAASKAICLAIISVAVFAAVGKIQLKNSN